MTDENYTLDSSLADLNLHQWIDAVEQIVDEDGYVESLGKHHHALFFEDGQNLIVSFETLQGIQVLSDRAQPLGWDLLRDAGWSSLTITSNGDTWFRDPAVYGYFDRLIDDGFFDEFDNVVFYGAGPCGYAAAAFSVASPGAKVVAIQPQATLDPRVTEWDDRFADMRRTDFTSRYGFAPEMLDAADQAFVLYDPHETLDAMHAALFSRPNVQKFRLRCMGNAIQTDLLEMEIWSPLIEAAGEGTLNRTTFAQLYRARRDHRPYLRNLLEALDAQERETLVEALCRNVGARIRGRRFAVRLQQIEQSRLPAAEQG